MSVITGNWFILSDEEFVRSSGDIVISPGTVSVCFVLFPVDDDIVENPETFTILLDTVDSALTTSNASALVTIENDDGKCLLNSL